MKTCIKATQVATHAGDRQTAMDSSTEETPQASESVMATPTSESEMATPTKEEIPSFIGILDLGWVKFKKGLYKRLTEARQHLTEAEKPRGSSPHGLRFLKAISCIQLILGFLCICLAVIAVAAAFEARESAAYDYVSELSYEMINFYRKYLKNVTDRANAEKMELQMSFKKRIKSVLYNCSDVGSTYDEYDYDYNYGGYNNRHYYNDEFPYYCYDCDGDYRSRVKGYHLIIDYLATPSWTGLLLIITSLVGFRLVSLWNKTGYIQVSHSHTILNTFCCVFSSVMLAAGILQILFSEEWEVPFRHGVGITTVVFASVTMLLSILVCVINCCCPVSALEENHYKRFTEDMTPKENKKEQKKDDSDIIIA